MCRDNWSFSKKRVRADRLPYLSIEIEFKEIANCIYEQMEIVDYDVEDDPFSDELKNCKRSFFKIRVQKTTFDMFFNSPCGYRGQYYMSPLLGVEINRLLIRKITEKLIQNVKLRYADLKTTDEELNTSLSAKSPKIWVDEDHCDFGLNLVEEIINPRWLQYAKEAYPLVKNNPDKFKKRAIWGLRAPEGTILDVKGGWIDSYGNEHVPKSKEHRAEDICNYGFS